MYVGSSYSLYQIIITYFVPNLKGSRRVIRYFYRHGNISLRSTLLIIDPNSTSGIAVKLEQYCIDTLQPNLNVNPVAISPTEPIREYLRKLRENQVFIYDH